MTKTLTIPTAQDFADRFQSAIRVQFNWNRLARERWPIDVVAIQTKASFSKIMLPWFFCPDGPTGFDNPKAKPARLSDIEDWFEQLPKKQAEDVLRTHSEFTQGLWSTTFDVPGYALPDGDYILLDGNHRLSALCLANVPFSVNVWVVRGPLDSGVLPDLMYWSRV